MDFVLKIIIEHFRFFLGVDPSSQTAYNMASKGLIRPDENSPPIFYTIKLVEFEAPDFKLGTINFGYLMIVYKNCFRSSLSERKRPMVEAICS